MAVISIIVVYETSVKSKRNQVVAVYNNGRLFCVMLGKTFLGKPTSFSQTVIVQLCVGKSIWATEKGNTEVLYFKVVNALCSLFFFLVRWDYFKATIRCEL